jgi:general secretion pathway protein G
MIKKGFTLVELMIVVLILGALAAIAISRIMGCVEAGRDNACETNVNLINRHLELYHTDTDSWPATLEDFLEYTVYFPDGPPECPTLKSYKWDTKNGKYRLKMHKAKDHRP